MTQNTDARMLPVDAQRSLVVAEARRWIGTPYHHAADLLGVGVDCGMILVRVFVDTGLVTPFDPRPYSRDWHQHRSEEKYLEIVTEFAHGMPAGTDPKPGDVVVWWFGKCFSHGSIVTEWPYVVHAYAGSGTVEEANYQNTPLEFMSGMKRPYRLYSLWD